MVGNTEHPEVSQSITPENVGEETDVVQFPCIELSSEELQAYKALPRTVESTLFLFQHFLFKTTKNSIYVSGSILAPIVLRTQKSLIDNSFDVQKLSDILTKSLNNERVSRVNEVVEYILSDRIDYFAIEPDSEEEAVSLGLIALEYAYDEKIPDSTRFALKLLSIVHFHPELIGDTLWEQTGGKQL